VPLTLLVALTVRHLRKNRRVDLLVSFADKTQGHYGGIYQACGWLYAGARERAMDGLIINGTFTPGRSCNSALGTRSTDKLRNLHPDWTIEPHFDEGKHLYWLPLSSEGKAKAKRLELSRQPYPKPDRDGKRHRITPA
jgi:hypothetical protein